MVVFLATDVFVASGDDGRGFFELDLVELGVEDVLDTLVGVDAGRKGPAASSLQAFLAVAVTETQEAEAGTVGLLRMPAGFQEHMHQLGSMGAGLFRPVHEPLRRPLQVFLVGRRHMLRDGGVPARGLDTAMRSHALVLVVDLDRQLGSADVDLFVDEGVGDAVVVFFELDVVVDVDAGLLPDRKFVGLFGQRLQGRPVQLLKELAARALELKKVQLRRRARIQRSTTWTPTSALALSLGLRTRVGMTAMP
jgi:hypothetical protein